MIERALAPIVFSEKWGRQMRFLTGPRQSGKTTLARFKLKREQTPELYYLWDSRSVRNRYKENELFFVEDKPPGKRKWWVCFDEIHKMPKWKNILKGIFDSVEENYQFIIAGSAKLDVFRKAGDSLSGRFFTFHLFPLCLPELIRSKQFASHLNFKNAQDFILRQIDNKPPPPDVLTSLLELSGFPEPFSRHSKDFHTKWAQDYMDTVIREDIRVLTRITDQENLHGLYSLLPQMAGNPISEFSLASHLELSPPTIKNYLRRLEEFYLSFKIHPYSKNIKRSLLKAPKCYLYDWTQVKNEGKRFENFIAVQLLALSSLWSDSTGEKLDLFYIRNKQKEETDFLLVKNKTPWMLIETKFSDDTIPGHHYKIQEMLGNIPLIQLCRDENIVKLQTKNSYRLSASRFLS